MVVLVLVVVAVGLAVLPLLPPGLRQVLADDQVAEPQAPGDGRLEGPGEQARLADDGGRGVPGGRRQGAGQRADEYLVHGVVAQVDAAPGDGGGDGEDQQAGGGPLEERPGPVGVRLDHDPVLAPTAAGSPPPPPTTIRIFLLVVDVTTILSPRHRRRRRRFCYAPVSPPRPKPVGGPARGMPHQ